MSENKKLFSIGKVAESVGVTRRIILNYEEKGLIKPDVKDGSTGNRYYTIDTYTQIRTIRIFQDLGLSLAEIKGYFEGTTDLMAIIKKLEKLRNELNLSIEKLYERANSNPDKIEIITLPAQNVYRRTYRSLSVEEKTVTLRETALKAMNTYGTDITKRMYFIEYPIFDTDIISYCVAVPEEASGEFIEMLPEVKGVSMYHHGAYEEIPNTVRKLLAYAKENGIDGSGYFRHVYLEGPPQHKDKSKFITQIILLCK